ncbi:PIR Superfamily Protein [Plasmodium ovale wallikeri]|uniref:PIR Superfamily Protein n=1 Tax=Plasmodium ovale wallikeri TaxID=864142 RepID=A0A1A9AMB3_PLAOA|nr:PIR Superfamily Protein [Plasmodium ovale wallikeri]
MPCKKWTGKDIYAFCMNSNYYEALEKYVKGKSNKVKEEKECDNISTSMTFSNDIRAKDICQEFKFLHKSLRENPMGGTTVNEKFSDYDCDFLNFWLNNKLRKNVNNGSIEVKEFYEKIKNRDNEFFTKNNELDDHMRIIDLGILENMKLLYELYDTKQKILDIMLKQDDSSNQEKLCPEYTKTLHDNYIQAMKNCLKGYDNFYNELKFFERDYKYFIEKKNDESGYCKSSDFFQLPEYDPVLETKQRRIIITKILSAPLILPFVIPLLYKYTPFGPFLRTKINLVKKRWLNPYENGNELLPMPTDTEDIFSDNEEYNIGYYSETN